MKHYTILELNNDECPMMGTIQNVTLNDLGLTVFEESIKECISIHFDIVHEAINLPNIKEVILSLCTYEDITVLIDGNEFEIRILETWFY